MSSLNYGHVMERAARDYQREMMMQEEEEEEKRRKTTAVSVNVLDEGGDDDEEFVRQMQKKRLEQLKNGTFFEATTLMVVRWCFGGRNHRTCDDGLFYFSDGRKRERDAEENDVFVHSLARAASFFVFFFFVVVVFLS